MELDKLIQKFMQKKKHERIARTPDILAKEKP